MHHLFSKEKVESQSPTRTIGDYYATAVELHRMLHDGKAKARASNLAGAPFVHTVESLEETRKMLLIDTAAIVLETDAAQTLVILYQ
jgi:hypothetical protein